MTVIELLDKFEEYFGKEYTDAQRAAFVAKLTIFDERDLPRVYSEILEVSKRLPFIAEVFAVGRAWGLIGAAAEERVHHWEPTTCKLCAGEGRVWSVWGLSFDDARGRWMERLEHVMPYSSAEARNYHFLDGEYGRVARCRCEAGDAPTLPHGVPRWPENLEPVRLVR